MRSVTLAAATAAAVRITALIACMPDRVHERYTREDDHYLWAHQDESLVAVAAALGRGTKSVQKRLERLRTPTTEGYRRLFGEAYGEDDVKGEALRPVRECIQRITYDPSLDPSDFRVGFRDRFRTALTEVPFDAPNDSIEGQERFFVLALPGHRIEYLKYRRRVVWHKERRTDNIFGSCGGLRIQHVVAGYDEWESERRAALRRANVEALCALDGDEEALAAFKKQLSGVHAGAVPLDEFVQLALSPQYFGLEGNGGTSAFPERGEMLAGEEPDVALIQLVSTLPDEAATLRDDLVRTLSERMHRPSEYVDAAA